MKGMLGLLEKAGLVRVDPPDHPAEEMPRAPAAPLDHALRAPVDSVVGSAPQPKASQPLAEPLALGDIYAKAGVASSNYPAERLLRLLDGLNAMDEPVRLMAIKAMDAADESWTIEDPLSDARAKLQALGMHAELVELNLQALERDTQKNTQAITERQEKVSADIRQQMAELEALMAREVAKATQEISRQEALLGHARDRTASELAKLSELTTQFNSLITRFGAPPATPSASAAAHPKE